MWALQPIRSLYLWSLGWSGQTKSDWSARMCRQVCVRMTCVIPFCHGQPIVAWQHTFTVAQPSLHSPVFKVARVPHTSTSWHSLLPFPFVQSPRQSWRSAAVSGGRERLIVFTLQRVPASDSWCCLCLCSENATRMGAAEVFGWHWRVVGAFFMSQVRRQRRCPTAKT